MGDVVDAGPARGMSSSHMRAFVCKDCQREVATIEAQIRQLRKRGGSRSRLASLQAQLAARSQRATYNENWARVLLERGGSRSDRCQEHRAEHSARVQGLAVAYIDVQTVGEVADRKNPTGPLGGLGPLPTAHEEVPQTQYDLQEVKVGMTDDHVLKMITLLRAKRVLVLKAGTGTGKSTFAPYRLMDPPPESLVNLPPGTPFAKLTDLGPIIVTEPRVQAAVGVASFVGGTMSGAGGFGPGYPVGYQVSGDRNHDEACELIYVTDGTMINWLREGRLSRIGTVIVDEAHERSTNIDFIMGYLRQELDRYPHLRVIITSATFNTDFYQEYFGGAAVANVMDVPAEKSFGYGMPLFANLDAPEPGEEEVLTRWTDKSLPLWGQAAQDPHEFIRRHWPKQFAPALSAEEVTDPADIGAREDVWDTTSKLLDLRFVGKVPLEEWRERMPEEMAQFVIELARGLDERGIYGDILGFLATRRTIEPVCSEIERALGKAYRGQVFPLISTLPKDRQRQALAKRRKGDPRKIVISTNLAETSLTVEGVRFVVDSGVIAQSEWDPALAQGWIPTKPHSQAGIKQRWGRVGRKAPGWVFPLYSKGQYLALAEDTPPGSTRENLESLVLTAKIGGIDDVSGFQWPAAFEPETTELDQAAITAREGFLAELQRAEGALAAGGAVDGDGHPTSFGKELVRFQGLGSTGSALAILYADRLTCVPEVATILALLEDTRLIEHRGLLQDDRDWPDEWRLEAFDRHRGLADLCEDDAELVLLIAAAWERADPSCPPWQESELRQAWARQWWVSHELLLEAAKKRHEVFAALSPAMKEDTSRFLEPALINRARGVVARALAGHLYVRAESGEGGFVPGARASGALQPPPGSSSAEPLGGDDAAPSPAPVMFQVEDDALIAPSGSQVIALRRREGRQDSRISSLVNAPDWALPQAGGDPPTSVADAMRMVTAASKWASPEASKSRDLQLLASWPVGQRMQLEIDHDGALRVARVSAKISPFPWPGDDDEQGRPDGPGRRGSRRGPRRSLDDDEQATREDSDGSLSILAGGNGFNDERAEASAVESADRAAGTPTPCGECPRCLEGLEQQCQRPAVDDADEVPGDIDRVLESWLETARADHDVSHPEVVLDDHKPNPGQWYEVIGYVPRAEHTAVQLRADWRGGRDGNPAHHEDVAAGDPVEVVVGPMHRHHGGPLRSFERIDGKGRFVLAEASSGRGDMQEQRREIAVSLNRRDTTLLSCLTQGSVLTATVVPARAAGCYTITLLELLHQHLQHAQSGPGVEYHVLDPTKPKAARVPLHAAVVAEAANEHGYVTARLLHQDGVQGIVHRFNFKDRRPAQIDAQPESEPGSAGNPAPLEIGDPVLVNLVTDQSELDVSGLDLDAIEEIVRESQGQLQFSGAPPNVPTQAGSIGFGAGNDSREATSQTESSDGVPDVVSDAPLRLAPPGTELRLKWGHPLSRWAAERLCDLIDDPTWPNEVWAFWARSHHLKAHDSRSFLLGTNRDVCDAPASVVVQTGSPLEQERIRVHEYALEHPVNNVVECTVKNLGDRGAYVELAPELEGLIPTRELSWAYGVHHASQVVAPGDRLTAQIMTIPDPPAKITLSAKEITPDPFAAYGQTHAIGATVRGTVKAITDKYAYVDLGADVDGAIHVSKLAHQPVERVSEVLAVGDEVEVRIVGFNAQRRQVELSRKALLPPPYEAFKAMHSVGDVVRGVVRGTNDSFAYIDLHGGVNGAIHVSKLATHKVAHPTDFVTIGSTVEATILGFKDDRKQVELSLQAVPPTAARTPPQPSRARPPAQPPASLTVEGETVDSAIDTACAQLGVRRESVTWEVLDPGAPGRFLRRKRPAKVRVTRR